jgi:hypothetical protein
LIAHGRQQFVLVIRSPRELALIKGGGEDRRRKPLVDGRLDRPAPLAGIRNAARVLREILVFDERRRCQIQQPRSDHTPAAPNFGHVANVEFVLAILELAQRGRLRVDFTAPFADVCLAQDPEASRRRKPWHRQYRSLLLIFRPSPNPDAATGTAMVAADSAGRIRAGEPALGMFPSVR